jgi:hypothetical protein
MKKLKIWHDQHAMNPWKDWDCEPDLMFKGNDFQEDYSEGSILSFIEEKATDGIIIRHQKKIAEILVLDLECFEDLTKEEKAGEIRWEFSQADMKQLEKLCNLLKIPCMQYTSRGCSQSDWAEVLIVLTDEFFEKTGCKRNHSEEILKGTSELFDNYAWGNVYGFSVVEVETCECCGEESEEVIDSCGGFYGDNFEENGMLDYLDKELHEQLKNFDHSDIEY